MEIQIFHSFHNNLVFKAQFFIYWDYYLKQQNSNEFSLLLLYYFLYFL
jgi:hypothetical protein